MKTILIGWVVIIVMIAWCIGLGGLLAKLMNGVWDWEDAFPVGLVVTLCLGMLTAIAYMVGTIFVY